MKMNLRKVYSIVMASLSLLLIIFSFLPYVSYGSYASASLWSTGYIGIGVVQMILLLCIITLYLLHLFIDLGEKWIKFANYGVGFIVFVHLINFFTLVSGGSGVGFWFEFLLSLGLGTISVLWYFASEQPFASKSTPIVGYDPATGKPIYAKIRSYDPKTGKPIYEEQK